MAESLLQAGVKDDCCSTDRALEEFVNRYGSNKAQPFDTSYIDQIPQLAEKAMRNFNAFILCPWEQLNISNEEIIEISPPPVQSKVLFPSLACPNIMPWQSCMIILAKTSAESSEFSWGNPAKSTRGLVSGNYPIIIGSIGPDGTFHMIIDKRRTALQSIAKRMGGK